MFPQKVEEGFPDVGGNPVIIWGIEPYNFSSSLSTFVTSYCTLKKERLDLVSALLERLLIRR